MILVDANILLYAHNDAAQEHERCRDWLLKTLASPTPVAFSWLTICAFLRIATNPGLFPRPLKMKDASTVVDQWLTQPNATVLKAGDRHWQILSGLLSSERVNGAKVMDAHLAALALEHGAILASADRDFALFKELRVVNPLKG